ncbi:MAG TPA: PIN domain-containing protein [Thermoanaerobaculia bacterium]|nr:PIN domain-containing protein [Thermoanaerobaculia bacterium]
MSDRAFLDTNVLLYAMAQDDERAGRAEALLAGGGVVSVQVLNEFAAVAHRKLSMSWEDVAEALAVIKILCPSPIPITLEMHEAALSISMRYGYHICDALVIAAALNAGCGTLYSEDFQAGQVIDGLLTIRNPFNMR